jgi:IS30 family transposase
MTDRAEAAISSRYLSLTDRLAIADGLINKQSITEIAEGIGKHKSTVSREVCDLHGIRRSTGRVGSSYDNALAESL